MTRRPSAARPARRRAPAAAAAAAVAVALALGAWIASGPVRHARAAPRAGTPARRVARGGDHRRRPFLAPLPARARRYAARRRAPVPILMYHVIAPPPAGTPYPELWTPPARFAAQMSGLRRAGFHAVTLADAVAAWRRGLVLPRRPVVVSFDDGYESQYRDAARTLRRLGWPGVLFLEVHNMRVAGGLRPRQVRALLAAGWELGSHTLTHPDLTTLGVAGLRRELAGSRAVLRRRFGVPVASFCYPAGRFDAAVEAATRAAGYRAAATELPGAARAAGDPLALPRIRVDGSTAPSALVAAVRAAQAAAAATSGRPS